MKILYSTAFRKATKWLHTRPQQATLCISSCMGLVCGLFFAMLGLKWTSVGFGLVNGLFWLGVLMLYRTFVSNHARNVYDMELPDWCRDALSPVQLRSHEASASSLWAYACPSSCDDIPTKTMPVLRLDNPNPYIRGHGHGYLMQKEIGLLVRRFLWLDSTGVLKYPAANQYHVPLSLLNEMRGLVDGYMERWNERYKNPSRYAGRSWYPWTDPVLTLDTVLKYHMLPDSMQYDVFQMSCTCILHRNPITHLLTMGRNMDWLPFGLAGSLSVLIRTPRCAYWTPPGFVGVVTGINPQGLCLAMNVFPGERHAGPNAVPVSLVNRILLESCGSVAAVMESMKQQTPLGAYHLTVCDRSLSKTNNATFSIYQTPGRLFDVVVGVTECVHPDIYQQYRVVTNLNSHTREETFDSFGRLKMIRANPPTHAKDIQVLLNQPCTNTWETVHSMIFYPSKCRVTYRADNGFAASGVGLSFDYSTFWDTS